jgi:hypothetical protein
MSNKVDWKKFLEFQDKNKEFLIMIASPREDAISVSFGGLNAFVKFPGTSMEKGVVFNCLRKSKFNEAIDIFMSGIMKATDIDEKEEGGEVLKVLGGAVKAIGEKRELEKNNIKQKNVTKN